MSAQLPGPAPARWPRADDRDLRFLRRPEPRRRAILTVALEQLRRELPGVELTVFTRDVLHTRKHHPADFDPYGAWRGLAAAHALRAPAPAR